MHDKLVTIATFGMPMPDPRTSAEFARIDLESAGILCFLFGINSANLRGVSHLAYGGIQLQVKCSDAERALAILKETGNPPTPSSPDTDKIEGDEAEHDFFVCPVCSATDITYEKFSRLAFYLSILTFGIPLTFLKRAYRCNVCSHTWK